MGDMDLQLGKKSVADACYQHHGHQENYQCLDSHDGGALEVAVWPLRKSLLVVALGEERILSDETR